MLNHVHPVLKPKDADGLRRVLAPVHRRYAGHIHARRKRSGHFWQGRFGCVATDEDHLAAYIRYVALNPVRARLVERAQDWPWSSVRAHLTGRADGVTSFFAGARSIPAFSRSARDEPEPEAFERLRRAESGGRARSATPVSSRGSNASRGVCSYRRSAGPNPRARGQSCPQQLSAVPREDRHRPRDNI